MMLVLAANFGELKKGDNVSLNSL